MPLHDCPPPNLDDWLEYNPSSIKDYGHLLIEQKSSVDDEIISKLRTYFESAHLDAREVFHDFMGISLHPDGNEKKIGVSYPSSLHLTTLKGFFGEVLTGLLAESHELIGKHSWKVPVFLFRFHDDAEKYLFTLVRDPSQSRQTIGRLGTDFIGISVDSHGDVERLISGEAKWRKRLSQNVVDNVMLGPKVKGKQERVEGKGVWSELNEEVNPPNGLRELQIALKDIDPEGYKQTILSMDKLLSVSGSNVIPKTDLVVLVGEAGKKREEGTCLIDFEKVPEEYLASNDLQVVEVVLNDGEKLIVDLYASLWAEDV